MLLTLIIFIIILAILILVHEFGHFVVAKKSGVRVDEFGFGFPPKLFSWKKGETRYSINLVPLGGFVKIYGEQGEGKGEKNSFMSKSISRRAMIIASGVLMNFVLAIFLFSLGNFIGAPTVIDNEILFPDAKVRDIKVQIIGVMQQSPAEKAGFMAGDILVDANTPESFQNFVSANQGKEIGIRVKRGAETLNLKVVPERIPEGIGARIGVSIDRTGIVSYSWWKSIYKGIQDTIDFIVLIVVTLAEVIHKAFLGEQVGEVLTGPIGIYNITAQAAGMGFIYLIQLTALISINLGLINILPFPALDGGRLLFLAIEKIKGSPVSQRVENAAHAVGFALLILLMIFITWRDIVRFF